MSMSNFLTCSHVYSSDFPKSMDHNTKGQAEAMVIFYQKPKQPKSAQSQPKSLEWLGFPVFATFGFVSVCVRAAS